MCKVKITAIRSNHTDNSKKCFVLLYLLNDIVIDAAIVLDRRVISRFKEVNERYINIFDVNSYATSPYVYYALHNYTDMSIKKDGEE